MGEKREARLRSARLIPRKVEEAHTDTAIIVGRQVRALLKRVKGKLRARFDRETRFLSNRVVLIYGILERSSSHASSLKSSSFRIGMDVLAKARVGYLSPTKQLIHLSLTLKLF